MNEIKKWPSINHHLDYQWVLIDQLNVLTLRKRIPSK